MRKFVPVTKDSVKPRIQLYFDLRGDAAIQFDAICTTYKISRLELARQMMKFAMENMENSQ